MRMAGRGFDARLPSLMKISTRARYALRLMIDLARVPRDRPVVLREIAARQQISKRYLEQLTIVLRNAHLIVTSTGRGGGYVLARAPEEIRVGEIIRATLGEINVVDCVGDQQACARAEGCPSRRVWAAVNERIRAAFDDFSLADLAQLDPDAADAARCSI